MKAQASLEMAISFILVFLLFAGSFRLFFWVNQRLVLRQREYEKTRIPAANITKDDAALFVDETKFPRLDILGEQR